MYDYDSQVLYGWKTTHEFMKRLDPDLPFCYYTSSHTRYYEGDMPAFSEPSARTRKPRRAPRCELLGLMFEIFADWHKNAILYMQAKVLLACSLLHLTIE